MNKKTIKIAMINTRKNKKHLMMINIKLIEIIKRKKMRDMIVIKKRIMKEIIIVKNQKKDITKKIGNMTELKEKEEEAKKI